MIVSAALVPAAPLLLRQVTGTADPAPDLRSAVDEALARLVAPRPDVVHVVAPAGPPVTPASFAPLLPDHGQVARPLGHLLADRLLAATGWRGPLTRHQAEATTAAGALAYVGAHAAAAGRSALLVVGDGSARRGVKAPGYVDPRALSFDEQALDAVAGADPARLRRLDGALARELLVEGWGPWQVLAGALGAARDGAALRADVLYAADPFGVLYLVVSFTPPRTSSP